MNQPRSVLTSYNAMLDALAYRTANKMYGKSWKIIANTRFLNAHSQSLLVFIYLLVSLKVVNPDGATSHRGRKFASVTSLFHVVCRFVKLICTDLGIIYISFNVDTSRTCGYFYVSYVQNHNCNLINVRVGRLQISVDPLNAEGSCSN